MKNYKVGDRFRFYGENDSIIIWEVLERINEYKYKSEVLEVSGPYNTRSKGEIVVWGVGEYDTYLGNFGKANNFDNLYNKLNNGNINKRNSP